MFISISLTSFFEVWTFPTNDIQTDLDGSTEPTRQVLITNRIGYFFGKSGSTVMTAVSCAYKCYDQSLQANRDADQSATVWFVYTIIPSLLTFLSLYVRMKGMKAITLYIGIYNRKGNTI